MASSRFHRILRSVPVCVQPYRLALPPSRPLLALSFVRTSRGSLNQKYAKGIYRRRRTEITLGPTRSLLSIRYRIRSETSLAMWIRSEEHTSELQSLMRISYAVFCLKKKTNKTEPKQHIT